MAEQAVMVRVNLHESDHGKRRTLMEEVLRALQDRLQLTGVSVFRGMAGLSHDGIVHASDMMHFDVDLPLIVEFYATPKIAGAAIELLTPMVPAGHIVSWSVTRHGSP